MMYYDSTPASKFDATRNDTGPLSASMINAMLWRTNIEFYSQTTCSQFFLTGLEEKKSAANVKSTIIRGEDGICYHCPGRLLRTCLISVVTKYKVATLFQLVLLHTRLAD